MLKRRSAGRIGVLGLVVMAAAVAGCSGTTRSGVPYVLKVDREMRSVVRADLETTHRAAIDTLGDHYLFTIEHQAVDAREGIVQATSARGRRIRVETYWVDDLTTVVDVHVSPSGGVEAMQDVTDMIVRCLGEEYGAYALVPAR